MMNAEVFPLLAFVSVDPDVIRRYLPEFESYVEQDPMMAGEMTRKEVRVCLTKNICANSTI